MLLSLQNNNNSNHSVSILGNTLIDIKGQLYTIFHNGKKSVYSVMNPMLRLQNDKVLSNTQKEKLTTYLSEFSQDHTVEEIDKTLFMDFVITQQTDSPNKLSIEDIVIFLENLEKAKNGTDANTKKTSSLLTTILLSVGISTALLAAVDQGFNNGNIRNGIFGTDNIKTEQNEGKHNQLETSLEQTTPEQYLNTFITAYLHNELSKLQINKKDAAEYAKILKAYRDEFTKAQKDIENNPALKDAADKLKQERIEKGLYVANLPRGMKLENNITTFPIAENLSNQDLLNDINNTISLLEGTSSGFIAQDNTSNTISLSDATKKYSQDEIKKLEAENKLEKELADNMNKLNDALAIYMKDLGNEDKLDKAYEIYKKIDQKNIKDKKILVELNAIKENIEDLAINIMLESPTLDSPEIIALRVNLEKQKDNNKKLEEHLKQQEITIANLTKQINKIEDK